jgi:ribosomal protein S18 acetylase RimI-like enzyme
MSVRVRRAEADDLDAAAAVLSEAFVDEAGQNYWLPQDERKDAARGAFFDLAVRDGVHPKRELWIAEDRTGLLGAAIWVWPHPLEASLSPERQRELGGQVVQMAGMEGAQRGGALGAALREVRPTTPHVFLAFLGVAPKAHGRGVGSALLREALARVDADKLDAVVECNIERNKRLYERHGFAVTGEVDLPGIHFWSLTRAPR